MINQQGVITGEDEIKSIESEIAFGGLSNVVLDNCYHSSCDTVAHLMGQGRVILEQNLNLLAYLVQLFSTTEVLFKEI